MSSSIRIASGQGFWGDQIEAPKQQIANGPIDFLVLDYLAEVTMSIMQKLRTRDPELGYARDFVALMAETLPTVVERGIRVVANAGGVNPEGCVDAVLENASKAGLGSRVKVGVVIGDDILPHLDELQDRGLDLRNMESGEPLSTVRERVRSANVYIGGRPIAEALARGADIVVTGRSVDPALTYAPMVHSFGWRWDDYDRVAAGVVAGHLNECGAQASGGNCLVDWQRIPDLASVGYPIIEAAPDGSFAITKHEGTGGRITVAGIKEQLLYEIGDPTRYLTPDATADFTSIELLQDGENRVRVHGVRGSAPPDLLKVNITYSHGYRAEGSLVYAWPDAIAKARAADRILRERLDRLGLRFDEVLTEFVGWNATHGPLAGPPPDLPEVTVRWAVRGSDRAAVERFGKEIAPLVLAGPPTVTGYATGRPKPQEIIAYWPALIPRSEVDGRLRVEVRGA
ncbi:MAG: acyclic terpene utilization AtuA family protein [Gemmatimonadota bacterium]